MDRTGLEFNMSFVSLQTGTVHTPSEETDILLLSRDEEMEVLRSLSSWNPYVMDDAELLKDLRGLGKPPLFEDDSILLRRMDDVVDTSPDTCH